MVPAIPTTLEARTEDGRRCSLALTLPAVPPIGSLVQWHPNWLPERVATVVVAPDHLIVGLDGAFETADVPGLRAAGWAIYPHSALIPESP